MAKRRLGSLVFAAWIGWITLQNAAAEKSLVPPDPEIHVGERLVYKITWLRIPVALGEIWVKEKTKRDGREIIYIAGKLETNKALSKILPMHDEAHSWIDAKTYESVQFEKKIDELLINAHERMVFDAAAKKGYYESFKTGEKKEFDIRVPVHDVISAFYWARRQSLRPGQMARMILTADQTNWDLEIGPGERKRVKMNGQKIETLRIDPVTRVGTEEKRGRASFYLTTDASRTPVRITFKAPFGRVVGTLIENSAQPEWKAR